MSVASELAVRFTADTSGLEAGGTKATGVIGSIADKLGKLGLAGMGVGIVKDAVGAIAGSFGGLIEAAEAAGDAKARLDIVLGSDLSAVVEDNASIANSLGMTKTAYLEAAGAASNYLVNLGVGKDAAAEMAVGLTDLAPKLAAFTGADPSAVTNALEKGIGGATRGLKELGIAIDTEAISKLPKAAQAAAIYDQILAQSGGAQQAWADNQGDVANSMARVSAAMDDAKAAIGEGLLPIIAPLAEKLADLASTAGDIVTPAMDYLKAVFSGDWGQGASESFAKLEEKLGPFAYAISGAVLAMDGIRQMFGALFSGDPVGAFDELGGVVSSLLQTVESLTGLNFDPIYNFLFGDEGGTGAWNAAYDTLEKVVDVVGRLAGAFKTGFADAGGGLDGIFGGLMEIAASLGVNEDTLANASKMYRTFMDEAGAAISGIVGFVKDKLIPIFLEFGGKVMSAIGGIDWAGIIGSLVSAFNNARPGIEAFIAALVERFTYFKDEILPPVIQFVTGTLIPAFADFAKRAADGFAIVAPFVTTLAAKFMEFGNVVIEKVWPILKRVFEFIGEHSGTFVTIGAVIAMVAGGPITMLIGALALIGTIVPKVIEWFTTVRDTIASAVEAARAAVSEKVAAIVQWWEQLRADTAAKWQAIKDGIAAAVDAIRQWITDKFNAIRDFIRSVQDGIRNIILGVWNKIPADIRERLVEIYNNVVAKFAEVKFAIATAWDTVKTIVAAKVGEIVGGIKEWFAGMVDNVREAFTTARDAIADTVGGWRDVIVEKINGFLDPIRQKWQEIREAIVSKVGEITGAVREKFTDIKNAITGKLGEAKTAAGEKAREILDTLLNPFKNIFADISRVGKDLLDGLRQGITNSWQSFKDWFWNKIRSIVGLSREAVDAHSPSQEFARLGEDIVAGLRLGLIGLRDVAAVIQEVFGKMIGSADVENFEMIHRLTSSLLGIFEDASDGIRKLLDFDIVATTDQIKAAFDRLVEVFMVAVGQMAELSKFAGRGTQPGQEGFINLDHINNIERFTGAVQNTLNVAAGTLDILEKLSTLALPGAGAITALIPFLQEVANAAAVFEKPLGKDEDAIQVFERGAIVAGHIATFAKNVADLTSIKFSAVSSAFAREMTAAAAAAELAWQAVKDAAALWGDKISTERDKLIVGVKAYAEAVGAAVSILKGAAELDFEDVTFATATQLAAAAQSAADALVSIMAAAKWWIDAPKEAAKVVEGVKAYAEAAGAAVGLLRSAGDLDFSEAVAVTSTDLGRAASAAERALEAIAASADWWARVPEEAAKVVAGVKAYADAAGAAVGLLGSAGALDFSKAVAVTSTDLGRAADVAEMAYEELRRIAAGFIDMGEEMTGPIVAGIKAFADAAGAALDLLAKGAGGMNALGEIKKLAGVQPRLIRQIMAQLAYIVNAVAAEVPTVPEETVTRLKGLADLAGVFDPLAKAAEGMNALGEVKRLAGVQPRLIRAILAGVNAAVSEVAAGAGSFGTEAIAKVKAWGEASAVTIGALTTAADGLNKMSAKLTIPDDLSARVTALVTAMRIVVDSMADALDAGAIRLDVAKAGADVAAAVGAIADAMGPVFDAINAAISSPFGRIRATGQRGDTFRQNIANRIRASIVAAVTAISDALKELPTINVPDELVTQVDKLASVYERILDVVERLGEVRVDMRAVTALSAAMATLAGGVAAGAPGGAIAVTAGGSGTTLTVSSGPGGGIEITNVYSPTVTPMPVTISTTNNINIGQRTIETIATEVKILQELELRQGQTT